MSIVDYESSSWALDDEGKLVHAEHTCTGKVFTCLECKGAMARRGKYSRGITRCGVTTSIPVRAHFYHRQGTLDLPSCGGESVEHRAAKLVVARDRPKLVFRCTGCEKRFPVHYQDTVQVGTEEVPFKGLRLDVGFTDPTGRVAGAVEIYKTHRIGEDKATLLTASDIAWAEVSARAVLAPRERGELDEGDRVIEVLRCAIDLCGECAEREARIAERQQEELLILTARVEAARRVRERRGTDAFYTAAHVLTLQLTPAQEQAGPSVVQRKRDRKLFYINKRR